MITFGLDLDFGVLHVNDFYGTGTSRFLGSEVIVTDNPNARVNCNTLKGQL